MNAHAQILAIIEAEKKNPDYRGTRETLDVVAERVRRIESCSDIIDQRLVDLVLMAPRPQDVPDFNHSYSRWLRDRTRVLETVREARDGYLDSAQEALGHAITSGVLKGFAAKQSPINLTEWEIKLTIDAGSREEVVSKLVSALRGQPERKVIAEDIEDLAVGAKAAKEAVTEAVAPLSDDEEDAKTWKGGPLYIGEATADAGAFGEKEAAGWKKIMSDALDADLADLSEEFTKASSEASATQFVSGLKKLMDETGPLPLTASEAVSLVEAGAAAHWQKKAHDCMDSLRRIKAMIIRKYSSPEVFESSKSLDDEMIVDLCLRGLEDEFDTVVSEPRKEESEYEAEVPQMSLELFESMNTNFDDYLTSLRELTKKLPRSEPREELLERITDAMFSLQPVFGVWEKYVVDGDWVAEPPYTEEYLRTKWVNDLKVGDEVWVRHTEKNVGQVSRIEEKNAVGFVRETGGLWFDRRGMALASGCYTIEEVLTKAEVPEGGWSLHQSTEMIKQPWDSFHQQGIVTPNGFIGKTTTVTDGVVKTVVHTLPVAEKEQVDPVRQEWLLGLKAGDRVLVRDITAGETRIRAVGDVGPDYISADNVRYSKETGRSGPHGLYSLHPAPIEEVEEIITPDRIGVRVLDWEGNVLDLDPFASAVRDQVRMLHPVEYIRLLNEIKSLELGLVSQNSKETPVMERVVRVAAQDSFQGSGKATLYIQEAPSEEVEIMEPRQVIAEQTPQSTPDPMIDHISSIIKETISEQYTGHSRAQCLEKVLCSYFEMRKAEIEASARTRE